MIFRYIALVVVLLGLMSGIGCVSQQVSKGEPLETVLIVAGSGDAVTLQWKAEPGSVYTVVYTDKLGGLSEWKTLPNGQNLLGTGQMITIKDPSANASRRYYRLRVRRGAEKKK